MTDVIVLRDPEADRVWREYFENVTSHARYLSAHDRAELILELEDHARSSLRATGKSDADHVRVALRELGDPAEYLRPIIAYELLARAGSSLNPVPLVKGLTLLVGQTFRTSLWALTALFGYTLLAIFVAMALGKGVFPGHIGFFVFPDGSTLFGIGRDTGGAKEMLGWWSVPIALAGALLLYVFLTRIIARRSRNARAALLALLRH